MLGIDTNILLRWLIADETAGPQAGLAQQLMVSGQEVMISPIVLAEFSWVAERSFGLGRKELVHLLTEIASGSMIIVPDRDVVLAAIEGFANGGPGFADHLIAALNSATGCSTTLTFDKTAAKSKNFTLLT